MKNLISLIAVILISLNSFAYDTHILPSDSTIEYGDSVLTLSDNALCFVVFDGYDTTYNIGFGIPESYSSSSYKVYISCSYNISLQTSDGNNINNGINKFKYNDTISIIAIVGSNHTTFNFTFEITKQTQPTGINDAFASPEPTINIYPNPVMKELNITSSDMSNLVKIYDMTGKMVFSKTITSVDKIDMSIYPKGTYIVIIDDRISRKIVKQ